MPATNTLTLVRCSCCKTEYELFGCAIGGCKTAYVCSKCEIEKLKINNMKIIQLGKVEGDPKTKTCGYCQTIFEYDKNDIGFDRDGTFVECPNPHCNKLLSLGTQEDTQINSI